MADAFISYRRKPSASLALLIQEKLKNQHRVDAYVDTTRTDSTQVQFPDRLMQAITDAPVFVCLLGDSTLDSEWVMKEIVKAYELKKRCVPIFQESYVPPASPNEAVNYLLSFDGVHVLDVKNIFVDEALAQLAKLIRPTVPTSSPNAPLIEITSTVNPPKVPISMSRLMMVALAVLMVITLVVLFIQQATQKTDQVAQNITPTVETSSVSIESLTTESTLTATQTPPKPLNATEIEETVQGQMVLIVTEVWQTQIANETATSVVGTAQAQQTVYANETAVANQTATALQWTPTDTPDARKTAEARLTAQSATETAIAGQTVTMQAIIDAYTDTPTPTFTPTPTLSPEEQALQRARAFASLTDPKNADWAPYEQDFNGVAMVLVPAGCFMMGSTDEQIAYAETLFDGNYADEKPVHEQCFDEPFWLDKYEVTQAQFVANNGTKANANEFIGANLPVERITWFEARDYCQARGGRLPTEREWEYASRGVESRNYPWGNDFVADNVVYNDNSGRQTAPVGSRPGGVSWVGALDMSGNVSEWVSSLYQPYPYNATDGREDLLATDGTRGLRGGSWYDDFYVMRSGNRFINDPSYNFYYFGVRCVRA